MITMLILLTSISRQSPWFNDSNSGRIEVAAGQVLVGPDGSEEWFLAVSTEQPLKTGMRLRTSDDGRCQIRIGKDTVVRVDANSDVIFLDDNHIELLRGRVFCRAKSEEVRISLPDPQLSVRRATEVRCPEQTELQCDAFPEYSTVSSPANSSRNRCYGNCLCWDLRWANRKKFASLSKVVWPGWRDQSVLCQ